MDPVERRIAAKLLAVDVDPTIPLAQKMNAVVGRFTPEEQVHPLGQWIRQQASRLDWMENVGPFLQTVWDLPRYPWNPMGSDPEAQTYRTAAATVIARLQAEGIQV
ncbi:hypothetical protein SAMN00768000_0246 [Sulfobacillus thermosulfidooxidans DSM 9293]|uniref:Uncharacterized protein n=1 Tax=Sulfobacillus thermosulfidooxidans (strain DSM 9293 / VKM B-1269 / AT-1) TaxID=929705 RepID=A0A1W1W6X8_SULTA|nr:hypothetical protein [Sulfobacillus thermosulfidooxidans]SMC02036.1 hypothetical protein SAMN00768000_0246 [Sulfobacillus thermosulfidooxidans DSM 9293]